MIAPGVREPSMPDGVAVRFARDADEGEGPLAGVDAGLGIVETELAVLAGGDMPDLQVRVVLELVRVAGETAAEAVALQDGDRFRPLPAIVRADAARDAARSLLTRGERRLRDLIEALDVAVVDEATWVALDPERRSLFDVDEVDDLGR